jgi:hypothetical protein
MTNETSQVQRGPIRKYPGEEAARNFLAYVDSQREFPGWQDKYLGLLRGLQRLDNEVEAHGENPKWRLSKKSREAWEEFGHELYDHALAVEPWRLDWDSKRGFVMVETTERIDALLGLLELFGRRRLNRLRRCRHCSAWFYARFKHENFCIDPEKRCQWNHYHTPEWRKRNRERNRRQQREWRKRNFGR